MECRYSTIKDFDMNQADGISVSLWLQGCEHKCEGCFNKSTWSFEDGKKFTKKTIETVLYYLVKDDIHKNLSILGGEPLSSNKLDMLLELIIQTKKINKDIQIWIWTGYVIEELNKKQKEILNYIDVLVDGPYVKSKHNPTRYKGSYNQRVIDIKQTLKQGSIVLWEE